MLKNDTFDYISIGKALLHLNNPPRLPKDILPIFEADLPLICEEKLRELKQRSKALEFKIREYNFLRQQLISQEQREIIDVYKSIVEGELSTINYWLVYWEKIRRRCLKLEMPFNSGVTDEDIANAKAYPFEHLLGGKFKALCPFHEDRTPSFSVYRKQNYGKCFGCGWWGDTIDFIMKGENLSFPEAVKWLNEQS